MMTTGLVRTAGALVALAIISACGGGSAVAPSSIALSGRPLTAARTNTSPLPRFATIVSDLRAKPDVLYPTREYIINTYGSYASIFDYPKSDKQVGMINNVGGQGCTNVLYGYGKEIIWIVAGPNQITEYKVPQRPIKTLSVPYSFPTSCAMNASGDLAVGIYGTSGGGDVVIFKNANGTGTAYPTPLHQEFFDGYDPAGNLFADGFTGDRSGFALVELPKGSSKFQKIKTSNRVQFPGSVQWDGKYLVVTDQLANAMYQYTVSGTTATLQGTVSLNGSSDCAQTWIGKGVVICGDAGGSGEIYKYPAGGSPVAVLTGNFDTPLGTTAANK